MSKKAYELLLAKDVDDADPDYATFRETYERRRVIVKHGPPGSEKTKGLFDLWRSLPVDYKKLYLTYGHGS